MRSFTLMLLLFGSGCFQAPNETQLGRVEDAGPSAGGTAVTGGGAAGEDDVVATLGEGAAPRLRARWQSMTTALLTEWSAAASAARREHDRPPDYGDPEAALGVLERARDAVGAAMGEVRGLRVALRVRGFRLKANRHGYRTAGHAVGAMLVRGADRADRVAESMRARGFDGRFHTLIAEMSASALVARQITRAAQLPFASPNGFVGVQLSGPRARDSLVLAQQQHHAVLEAIAHREGSRAEALMREHARIAHGAEHQVLVADAAQRAQRDGARRGARDEGAGRQRPPRSGRSAPR